MKIDQKYRRTRSALLVTFWLCTLMVILPCQRSSAWVRLPHQAGGIVSTPLPGPLPDQGGKGDQGSEDDWVIAVEVVLGIAIVLWVFSDAIDCLVTIFKNWLHPPEIYVPPVKITLPSPPTNGVPSGTNAALLVDPTGYRLAAEPPPPDPLELDFIFRVPAPGSPAEITARVCPPENLLPLEAVGLTNSFPENNYAVNGAQTGAASSPFSADADGYWVRAPGLTNLVTLMIDRTTDLAGVVWQPCVTLHLPVGARVDFRDQTRTGGEAWFYRFRFSTP